MATKYKIVQVISKGEKGRMEITTLDDLGNTVTRHVVNGVGHHPDDAVPRMHQLAELRVKDLEERVQNAKLMLTELQQSKDQEQVLKVLKILGWKLLKDYPVAIATLQKVITLDEESLVHARAHLSKLQVNDPIMVHYV